MVAARGGTGSVGRAIEEYLASTTYRDYEQTTQQMRRPVLKTFLAPGIGNLPLAKMDAAYINRWLESAPTLPTKRIRLHAIRQFFDWCISPMHLITVNPTAGIKVKTRQSEGHHTWTNEEIAQFRDFYPVGSKARLALELCLALALRRGDAISIGRAHVAE
jgi:integrase